MGKPIFDCFDNEYKHPFGALRRGQPSIYNIRLPKTMHVTDLTLVMFRPGYKERFIELVLQDESGDDNIYSCCFTPNNVGIHHYYFTCVLDGRRRYIKRRGASEGVFEGEELFQLTVFDENLYTPLFIRGGIMYQIFPDRFCKSGKPHENVPTDRIMRDDWYATPYYKPDEKGIVRNNDYFGGDLQGIIEKLPYIKSLGTTVIYLNPIFEAHENHRYNTANYEKIDPLLGTEEDFKELCAKAKEMGISVILDGVFSHTGADSIYFNKFGRYGNNTGAYRDRNSPYYPWYSFTGYPDKYESWWGITTLPNVNENNPEYTNYICGENGILQKWIDLGAQGWRLDVADELPDEFLDNINKAVKAKGGDKIVYGEVWEDASNKEAYGVKRRYLLGDQLDSVMNYPLRDALIAFLMAQKDAAAVAKELSSLAQNYPKPFLYALMNLMGSHDRPRILNVLAGNDGSDISRSQRADHRLSQEERMIGALREQLMLRFVFSVPGMPCIYYGDEAGMQGFEDPFNRRTYPWGRENAELVQYFQQLGALRKSHEALQSGTIVYHAAQGRALAFSRRTEHDHCLTAVNAGDEPVTLTLPWDGTLAEDALSHQEFFCGNGLLRLTLEPYGTMLLTQPQE